MSKERKSPQQKKRLEYTRDHCTYGFNSSRAFPKVWQRKKARVNRECRRKAGELLATAKTALETEDIDIFAEDLTTARWQKSVMRERLHKVGTVTVEEKVRPKLERRAGSPGRTVKRDQRHDAAAASAVGTMTSLSGKQLLDFLRRAELLCGKRNADERKARTGNQECGQQRAVFPVPRMRRIHL